MWLIWGLGKSAETPFGPTPPQILIYWVWDEPRNLHFKKSAQEILLQVIFGETLVSEEAMPRAGWQRIENFNEGIKMWGGLADTVPKSALEPQPPSLEM